MKTDKIISMIAEKGFTRKEFAKEIGMNESSLSKVLTSKRDLTISEASKIMVVLELSPEDAGFIFLTN